MKSPKKPENTPVPNTEYKVKEVVQPDEKPSIPKTEEKEKEKPSEKEQTPVPENPVSEKVAEQLYLKFGDKGEKVIELQTKLNKFRYNIDADGEFGYNTDFAVKDFQNKVNLEVDGIAGPDTFRLLDTTPTRAPYLYNAAEYYQNIVNSNNCPSTTSYYIYVNLTRHVVCILTGHNHNWSTIKIYSCTVGKSSTPTITGKFTVGQKGLSFVTENDLICKYYTQIRGDYLFHSILYGIADSRLGMNLSHGCIRLATENAYYIYKNVPYGTGIWIQN
ncbi:MAG: L,D-transpeptidase family protein [Solirubrobacterales bacterium]